MKRALAVGILGEIQPALVPILIAGPVYLISYHMTLLPFPLVLIVDYVLMRGKKPISRVEWLEQEESE